MQSDSIKPVEYRAVVGFPGYRVGDDGSVWTQRWNVRRNSPVFSLVWKKMSLVPDLDGYLGVVVHRGGKKHRRKVQRLVLESFVGPKPDGMESCHEDGDLTNNRLTNLRWGTQESNFKDRERHGTILRGSKHGSSKLSDVSVRAIRANPDKMTQKQLAKKYGVTQSLISMVVTRTVWSHLD